MLVLLPFIIVGICVSAVLCCAAGYTGIVLPVMLLLLFAAGFAGALVLYVLALWLISLFVDMEKPQAKPSGFFNCNVHIVMGLLTVLSRIRLHVSGLEKIPEGRWLLVCNHRSNYDPIVTGWALRRCGLAFISKPGNLRIPIAGKLVHKTCYLGIDRENDRAAMRTILLAADYLKRDVVSFGIYPEGTRHSGPEMLPFRNGAFKIAQKAGVPIVIAAIRGTEMVHSRFPWRSTDVYLDICSVMDAETVALKKTSEIGEEVRMCINSASC